MCRSLIAAEIWGFKEFSKCNNVQNRAMRYYLGVHKFAPVVGMQGDLGWLSPKYRHYGCMLRYWNRLCSMNGERLIKHIFNFECLHCSQNWSHDMKNLCNILEIEDIYVNRSAIDVSVIQQKLFTKCQQEWKNNINDKPKLRTYVTFKSNLMPEDYLIYHLNRSKRSFCPSYV